MIKNIVHYPINRRLPKKDMLQPALSQPRRHSSVVEHVIGNESLLCFFTQDFQFFIKNIYTMLAAFKGYLRYCFINIKHFYIVWFLILFISGCTQSYNKQNFHNNYLNINEVPNPKWMGVLKRQPVEAGEGIPNYEVMSSVNRNCNKKTYKRNPAWFTPKEFDAAGSGDCKDYAICKYYALRKAGFSANQLALYIGYYKDIPFSKPEDHMILEVRLNNKKYILDNIIPYLPNAKDYFSSHFERKYHFNENGWDAN